MVEGGEMKRLIYVKTTEDDNNPIDGRQYHRVQKLYKKADGSHIVASGLMFMHLNEVKLFHSNSSGYVDGRFEIEAVYGTHDISRALKELGYEVEETR